ncbi:transglutaminase-like domain-containing protein [Microbacterium sp.]|uniref:transglutaminase-like domain-containing protein n=1 Tax=Microbacterium sp. TaxID=51671 RepID=UPI003A85BB10
MTRRTIVDLLAVALLLAVGIVGFGPTFEGVGYLICGVGALVIGLAIALLGRWRRLGVLALAGLTAVAYFLFGGALALPATVVGGVIPTWETLRRLALSAVTSWKELLTTVPPVADADGHLVVVFAMTLVASVLAGSLALRVTPAAWTLLPALLFLVIQILLGVAEPAAPLLQGLVFAVVAVAWLAVRTVWDPERTAVHVEPAAGASGVARRSTRTRRIVAGAAVLAVAAGAGVATAAFATPPTQRYVLRDFVVPPFDLHEYPSPLQSYRRFVRDFADEPLFTATGLPEKARVRLATMDAYNGVVYNVAEDGAGSSAAFRPLRANMSPDATGADAEVSFEIEGLDGVWLPDVGAVQEITFQGADADDRRRNAFYNDGTGTAVVSSGLVEGDAYTVTTVIPAVPSDATLVDVPFAPLKMPAQSGVPEGIVDEATDAIEEAESPIERARSLQAWLSGDGYFSHGLEGDPLSPSGHGAARIVQLLAGEQMIGDDEQYAVAMALIGRQLGMPARVVMGWYPDEDNAGAEPFVATGNNLHAWVEIAFDGYGWVPFDPTPDEDNEPSEQNTRPRANPKPQVLQPPPPAQEPAELPPSIAEEREQDDEKPPEPGWITTVFVAGGISLAVVLLLCAPFVIIGAVKASRRVRRLRAERSADRISGGWDELVDRAIDLRAPVALGATRVESAAVVEHRFEDARVVALAERADAEVYGPGEPSADEVSAFWREVDDIVGGMTQATTRRQRVRARLSLRSFRQRRKRS